MTQSPGPQEPLIFVVECLPPGKTLQRPGLDIMKQREASLAASWPRADHSAEQFNGSQATLGRIYFHMAQWSRFQVCAPRNVVNQGQVERCSQTGTHCLQAPGSRTAWVEGGESPEASFQAKNATLHTHTLPTVFTNFSSIILSSCLVFFFSTSLHTNILELFTKNIYKWNINPKMEHQTSRLSKP